MQVKYDHLHPEFAANLLASREYYHCQILLYGLEQDCLLAMEISVLH